MAIKLNWFKMLWLNSDERKALKAARNDERIKWDEEPVKKEEETTKSVCRNIIYNPVSKNITVIFWSGEVITKYPVEAPLYIQVTKATSEGEINELLLEKIPPPKVQVSVGHFAETEEEKEEIKDNLYVFKNNKDFEVIDGEVFMRPVKLALPAVVAATFIEIIEKMMDFDDRVERTGGYATPDEWRELDTSYNTLKMFWLKLATNALPQSREDTLVFVRKNDIHLTKNGNMILYGRILSVEGENKALVKVISQEYFRVKKWKKSPKNFWIWAEDGGGYTILKEKPKKKSDGIGHLVGNLGSMYAKIGELKENEYTSWNNRGEHIIKIGSIYYIDDSKINLDNGICAAGGLHAAAVNYDYSGFGDTPVVVLVNPSKAITVPKTETGKLRTTEMFVACINDKDPGIHFDEDSLDMFDDEYHDLTIQELEEAVKNKSFDKLAVQKKIPAIKIDDLADIKDALKNRVKQLV